MKTGQWSQGCAGIGLHAAGNYDIIQQSPSYKAFTSRHRCRRDTVPIGDVRRYLTSLTVGVYSILGKGMLPKLMPLVKDMHQIHLGVMMISSKRIMKIESVFKTSSSMQGEGEKMKRCAASGERQKREEKRIFRGRKDNIASGSKGVSELMMYRAACTQLSHRNCRSRSSHKP